MANTTTDVLGNPLYGGAMSPEQLKLLQDYQGTQKTLGYVGLGIGGISTVANALQSGEQVKLGYDQLREQRRQFNEQLALQQQTQNRLGDELSLAYAKTGRDYPSSGA